MESRKHFLRRKYESMQHLQSANSGHSQLDGKAGEKRGTIHEDMGMMFSYADDSDHRQ